MCQLYKVSPCTRVCVCVCLQASLCTVDIDSGVLECPDELPGMPNEERLVSQVTEKVVEHGVSCPDLRELPRSPDSLLRKPSIIEALRYCLCVCVCCSNHPPSPSQTDEGAVRQF